MATSYHMEALRRQRVIERAVAARIRMELASKKAMESVEPPSLDPADAVGESNKQSQQSNRIASARSSNRALSQHSSHHSRPSTAATLTRESQLLSPVPVTTVPGSPHGSAVIPGSQQGERPASKRESVGDNNAGGEPRDGSIHGSRSEKREGSKLSKRDTGSARSVEKPKSVTSSKRNSPIPEKIFPVTQEVPIENVKLSEPALTSHHSSSKSNRPESHNKSTNT